MAFCKNCGAQITEGARFCKRCGCEVGGSASSRQHETQPSQESQKQPSASKSKSGKGLRTLLLLIALIGIGYYLISSGTVDLSRFVTGGKAGGADALTELSSLSKSLGGLSSDGTGSPSMDDLPAPSSFQAGVPSSGDVTLDAPAASGMTDEELRINGISRGMEADFMGGEALRREFESGIYDLVDLQAETKKYDDGFYETTGMSLYGYSLAKYRNAYVGDWTSVGVYQTEFENVEHLKNEDVAGLIDRNMVLTDQVRYVHTKDKARMWIQGSLRMEGEPDIMECGNVSIKARDGFGFFWMYMPIDGVLFQYVYYTEDDGTKMVSCVKYNRTAGGQQG